MRRVTMINGEGGGYRLGAYREMGVSDQLRTLAEVGWIYAAEDRDAPVPRRHRVLPECGPSLCLVTRRDRAGRPLDPRLVLMGPIRRVRFFEPEPGLRLEGLRLRPERCRGLLGVDPAEHIDAIDELPGAAARRLPGLLDRLARTRTSDEAFQTLCAAVGSLSDGHAPSRTEALAHAVLTAIRRAPAASHAHAEMARGLGVSPRHLRRAVRACTGHGARYFQRVRRVQLAVSRADAAGRISWASLAVATGFYDQAHMVREMRDLTGATPEGLRAERALQG